MSEFLGTDWKIDPATHDLVLDALGEPLLVSGRACLAQDLRHRLTTNPGVLGFIQRDLLPGEVRDLRGLVKREAELDPRVVPGSASVTVLAAGHPELVLELAVLPIGEDRVENLVVRLGGFND